MIEGIAKLIIHRRIAENNIPAILSENMPIKKMASDPLIPSSAMVLVGIIVFTK